jgi:hydrogenase maturation protein HypF
VGFRPWVYRLAREQGIGGRVRNDAAGVLIDAFGTPPSLDAFLLSLAVQPPAAADISDVRWQPIPAEPATEFVIATTEAAAARAVAIPPDLATCARCAAEVADPADRRFGYAFTNCTDCGPRFTIAREVPYDRPATTMAVFEMCPDCRREYEDPGDRRFHAQPNACPVCGPRLRLLGADGTELRGDDPIQVAARALAADLVVAVKGIGGFHLACDATSELAVTRLRARKRREEKPFAVMVADLPAAERLADLEPEERALLAAVERPIVLVRRREATPLADAVAPRNPRVGLLLPYSPLHHLLLEAARRPLVMTSGNLAEEPIAQRNGEALARLRGVADLFLVHDREIATRCDDSVAQVVAGRPQVMRRSRGWVPRPVRLRRPVEAPVLACGAHLKNACCVAAGDAAHLGPHVGDLDSPETLAAFAAAVGTMERLLRVVPEVVAHDLHPQYGSTVYARRRAGAAAIGVQHHHAHVASALAEHGLDGPVLGLAWDGTGHGTDGVAWGSELLLADAAGFRRLATFRPLRLPGGDRAVAQPWRLALAVLDDAFDGEPPLGALPLFAAVPARRLAQVRRMAAAGLQSPWAHGLGRWFDALGALVLDRPESRYEGQVALAWNLAADPAETRHYPFSVEETAEPWQVDLRPLVRAAVGDLLAGRAAATIAAKFHNTIAAAGADLVRAAAARHGRLPVVLTGGCFQNALLADLVLAKLGADFQVLLHGTVPPGDGGIALGQVLVADAIARGERSVVCV